MTKAEDAWDVIAEAVWLVEEGACTPQCLFAISEDDDCHCRCREERHGWLRRFKAGVLGIIPLADLLLDACTGWTTDCQESAVRPHYIERHGASFRAFYMCPEDGRRWDCGWGSLRTLAQFHGLRVSEIDPEVGHVRPPLEASA